VEIQYKDYAVWQRKYLEGEVLEKQIRYWKEKMEGYENLSLITDKTRPPNIRYEGEESRFELGEELSGGVKEAARNVGVSVYTVLLSAYYLLLSTYSNQKDIVIGTVIANRQYAEIGGMIGFFVNTLVLRQKIDWEKDTEAFIKDVGEEVLEAQWNQDIPFEKLVEELGVEPDPSRSPVFQAMFTVQSFDQDNDIAEKLFEKDQSHENINKTAKFDISLTMEEGKSGIRGIFNYAVSLFERETIEEYIETYIEIIGQLLKGVK
jgi:non-ribosomal peptide synthetase component F